MIALDAMYMALTDYWGTIKESINELLSEEKQDDTENKPS